MRAGRCACALLLVAVAACRGADAHEARGATHDDDHETRDRAAERHAHADALTRVHVQPGMLRDLHLQTQPVEARPAGETIAALGELRVDERRYAEVGTAIEARVAKVLAAPGDAVEAGQPLVELESLEVARARAALAKSEVRVALAESTAARKRALASEHIAPDRELEAAQAELLAARAEQRAAEDALAALGATRGRGARFTLRSPLAGRVLERSALPGRRVDDSRPLFTVADLRSLWLILHAFERDALRVREGAQAYATFAALPGRSFEGRVTRVGAQVERASRTLDVRVELANPDELLRPGMSASARIALGAGDADVLTVPTHAVQRIADRWAVFLPTEEPGAFEIRSVGRGRDLGAEVEVLSGLREGEAVVVDGAFLLKAQVERARGGGEHEH